MRLKPYQHIGIEHVMSTPRSAVWAKPGMGKTAIALHALATLHLLGDVKHILVIAPKRVAEFVWSEEVEKWPDVKAVLGAPVVLSGQPTDHRAFLLRRRATVYTISWELIPWLVRTLGRRWYFDAVVADESSKLKGFRTKQGTARPRALAKVAHSKVKRFIELTGTPAANNLSALWGQLWFLDAGHRLGTSFEAFKSRWFREVGERGKTKLAPAAWAQDQVTALTSDLALTLDPKDWFDLREPVHTTVSIKLPKAAQDVYARVQREMYAELLHSNEKVVAFSAAAKTMKSLQIASGAVFVHEEEGEKDDSDRKWEEVHTAKMEALRDIIDETADSAVLVAYHFRPDLYRILNAFPGAVDLATPKGLKRFRDGNADIGVAHPASVGHGVDGLQHVCNSLVFFTNWWDAEYREQMIERVGPMRQLQAGNDRPLFLYDLVAEKTIDELVMLSLKTKRAVQDVVLEAAKKGVFL